MPYGQSAAGLRLTTCQLLIAPLRQVAVLHVVAAAQIGQFILKLGICRETRKRPNDRVNAFIILLEGKLVLQTIGEHQTLFQVRCPYVTGL
jgi:hypothetical protein